MGGRFTWSASPKNSAKTGVKAGDPIEVTIELDTDAPDGKSPPPDLLAAVDAAGIREAWEKLSYTHRKEHVRAIEEAKAPETRQRRIEKAVAMVTAKAR